MINKYLIIYDFNPVSKLKENIKGYVSILNIITIHTLRHHSYVGVDG